MNVMPYQSRFILKSKWFNRSVPGIVWKPIEWESHCRVRIFVENYGLQRHRARAIPWMGFHPGSSRNKAYGLMHGTGSQFIGGISPCGVTGSSQVLPAGDNIHYGTPCIIQKDGEVDMGNV